MPVIMMLLKEEVNI